MVAWRLLKTPVAVTCFARRLQFCNDMPGSSSTHFYTELTRIVRKNPGSLGYPDTSRLFAPPAVVMHPVCCLILRSTLLLVHSFNPSTDLIDETVRYTRIPLAKNGHLRTLVDRFLLLGIETRLQIFLILHTFKSQVVVFLRDVPLAFIRCAYTSICAVDCFVLDISFVLVAYFSYDSRLTHDLSGFPFFLRSLSFSCFLSGIWHQIEHDPLHTVYLYIYILPQHSSCCCCVHVRNPKKKNERNDLHHMTKQIFFPFPFPTLNLFSNTSFP